MNPVPPGTTANVSVIPTSAGRPAAVRVTLIFVIAVAKSPLRKEPSAESSRISAAVITGYGPMLLAVTKARDR